MRAVATTFLTLTLAACGGGTSATNGSSGALEPGQIATWIRNYGSRNEGIRDIVVADVAARSAGGAYVTGTVTWDTEGDGVDSDIWLARIDAQGAVAWAKRIGEPLGSRLPKVLHFVGTEDGGAVAVGVSRDGKGTPIVMRMNGAGSIVWTRELGTAMAETHRVCRGVDGGFLIAGTQASFETTGYRSRAWLVKIDADGNRLWDRIQTMERRVVEITALAPRDDGYVLACKLPTIEKGIDLGPWSLVARFSAQGYLEDASEPAPTSYHDVAEGASGDLFAVGGRHPYVHPRPFFVHRYADDLSLALGGDLVWDPGDEFPCSQLNTGDESTDYYHGAARVVVRYADGEALVGGDDGILARYSATGDRLDSYSLWRSKPGYRRGGAPGCVGRQPLEVLAIQPEKDCSVAGDPACERMLVLTEWGVWTYERGNEPNLLAEFSLGRRHAEALDLDGDGIRNDAYLSISSGSLRRVRPDGNIEWELGSADAVESAHAVVATRFGCVVLGTAAESARVLAFDEDGRDLWQRLAADPDRTVEVRAAVEIADGLVIGGRIGEAAWLTKLRDDGTVQIERGWTSTSGSLSIADLARTPAGEVLVAGVGAGSRPFLARLSPGLNFDPSEGHALWTYAGPGRHPSLAATADGGAILVASGWGTGDAGVQAHVRRIAPDGSVRWKRSVSLDGATDRPIGICATSGGGCVVAASTTWLGGDCASPEDLTLEECGNAYLVRLDELGDIEWTRVYGTGAIDLAAAVVPMASGGFLVGGSSWGYRFPAADAWLLRVDAVGEVALGCIADLTPRDAVALSEADSTDAVEASFLPEEFAGAVPELTDTSLSLQPLVLEVARSCSGVGAAGPADRAKVVPGSLSFDCEDGDGWTAAAVSSQVTLRGDWGATPTMRLVDPGATVRVEIDGTRYTDVAPLAVMETVFTVEVNPGAGVVPATLELEFLDSGGEPVGGATISLAIDCPECSPEAIGPFLFEWHPDPSSTETRIGVSDGGSAVAWTVLDAWKASAGITRVIRPTVSPDGRYLGFTAGAVGAGGVYVLDLKAGPAAEPVRITPSSGYAYRDLAWSHAPVTLPGASEASYALVTNRRDSGGEYSLKITLLSVPSDPNDLVAGVSGAGTPISTGTVDRVSPTWSPTDTRIAFQDLQDRSLYSVAIDGSDQRLEFDAQDLPGGLFKGVNFPTWHPTDDDRIAFHHNGAVYVLRRSSDVVEQYSPGSGRYGAAWTRDGDGILYLEGQANFKLLCGSGGEEASLFGLSGAEILHVHIPRTQAVIDVLHGALGR